MKTMHGSMGIAKIISDFNEALTPGKESEVVERYSTKEVKRALEEVWATLNEDGRYDDGEGNKVYDGYSKDNQLLWLQAYDNVIEEGEAPVVAAQQAYGTVKKAKRDAELARSKDRTLHSFWASDRRPVQFRTRHPWPHRLQQQ